MNLAIMLCTSPTSTSVEKNTKVRDKTIIANNLPNASKINISNFQVESADLIAYGLIPEFIGRFPILISLSALTEDQLMQVLYSLFISLIQLFVTDSAMLFCPHLSIHLFYCCISFAIYSNTYLLY